MHPIFRNTDSPMNPATRDVRGRAPILGWLVLALLPASCVTASDVERKAGGSESSGSGSETADAGCEAQIWYEDADGDGYGDPAIPVEACDTPDGAVEIADDCDDQDPDTNPDATERCDGIDNDCDATVDDDAREACPVTCADEREGTSVGYTCEFSWSQCSDGNRYEVACETTRAGSYTFSDCACATNGRTAVWFVSSEICGLGSWNEITAQASDECGWNLE